MKTVHSLHWSYLHLLPENHFLLIIPLVSKRVLAGWTLQHNSSIVQGQWFGSQQPVTMASQSHLILDFRDAGEELPLPIIRRATIAFAVEVGRASLRRGNLTWSSRTKIRTKTSLILTTMIIRSESKKKAAATDHGGQ